MSAITRDYEKVSTKFFSPGVTDNYFNAHKLFGRFRSKQKKENYHPKRKLVYDLEMNEHTATSVAELAVLDRTRKEVMHYFEIDGARYYVPLAISWEDELGTNTPQDRVKLLKKKAKNTYKTMEKKLTTDLISGDGASNNLVGFTTAVPNQTTANTYGGIDGTATGYTWWIHQGIDGASAVPTLYKINNLITKCSDGSDEPSILMTDKYMKSYIWVNLLQQQERYQGDTIQMARDLPVFQGTPILVDAALESSGDTAGEIYAFDESTLFLVTHSKEDMKRWPTIRPSDQFAFVTDLSWGGQLICTERRRQGVIYDLTTS